MHELRLAIRALRAAPAVSLIAMLSLALGMGANTAIFSILNALMLRPLPVVDPDRLVTVSSGYALTHGFKAGAGMSYDTWSRMRERIQMFDGGFAWAPDVVSLSDRGARRRAEALFVSGGFFRTLGVPALIGRTFDEADDVRGGGRDGLVAVLGHRLWQVQFDSRADVIGTALRVDGVPVTVVGVMPPEFFGVEVGQPFDLVIPLAIEPSLRAERPSLHNPRASMLTVMLRLRPGQRLDNATAELRAMQPLILGSGVPQHLREPYVLVPAATGTSDRSALRRSYARPLWIVMAVVALVLLVACLNIANLLLARADARRYELGVRLALGASRLRVARQLLLESLVISTGGAVAGLVLARWTSRALVSMLSTADRPVSLDLTLDWRVFAMAAAACALTASLSAIAPVLHARRLDPGDVLIGSRRRGGRSRLPGALVVVQVAVSMALFVSAALLVSTFSRLAALPVGFDADRILIIDVETGRAHADHATRTGYVERLAEAVSAVPGVEHAAASSMTPFSRATKSPLFRQPGRVHVQAVSPRYFATYGMTVRSGRVVDRGDSATSERVAVVSESFVHRFFPDGGAIGKPIGPSVGCAPSQTETCTIVGVVSDVVFASARDGARPTVYVPLAQAGALRVPGWTTASLSVRSASRPSAPLVRAVEGTLAAFDPRLTFSPRALERDLHDSLAQERLLARLSACFAGLGLLLAGAGVYGTTAYSVSRRRRETGIRLALGATRPDVLRGVLIRVAGLMAAGTAVGLVLSLWAARFLSVLLYDVRSDDVLMLAGSAAAVTLLGLAAAWTPACRAARTHPADILRSA